MVYTKKCPRIIAENSNCFTTKYDNVKENPVITRSIIKITHLGTGLEKDRNFFMLLTIVYNDYCSEHADFPGNKWNDHV
jgi:hypothetical protein